MNKVQFTTGEVTLKKGDTVELNIGGYDNLPHRGKITATDSGHPLYRKDMVQIEGIGDPVEKSRLTLISNKH